jgi:hypothetical protein
MTFGRGEPDVAEPQHRQDFREFSPRHPRTNWPKADSHTGTRDSVSSHLTPLLGLATELLNPDVARCSPRLGFSVQLSSNEESNYV